MPNDGNNVDNSKEHSYFKNVPNVIFNVFIATELPKLISFSK
jgi:hypothetical protein